MLTRIRVKSFKNLVDTEVRFGPFTCVAGLNGAGKSNLFDVIAFISDLASHTIVEAASRVRSHEGGASASLASLFSRKPGDGWRDIELEVDFFVPKKVLDDFDREAVPSTTFLTYKVALRYVHVRGGRSELNSSRRSLRTYRSQIRRSASGLMLKRPFWTQCLGATNALTSFRLNPVVMAEQ
jgi:energy-coupling factor transporter ATP-binding protein EcfA2